VRIGIVGAGALGTLFGYRLAAQHDVTLFEIDPATVAAVAQDGLRLEGAPARAVAITTNARPLFGAQVLFVFVRATDTMRALRPFVGSLDPACVIVSLQTGLANDDAIKATLGGSIALVVGATTATALTLGPGVVRPFGKSTTIVGPAGASPDTCSRVAALLVEAGLPAGVAYDIRSHLWGKLIATAAINPVAALLDRPNRVVLDDPDASTLARALAGEAAAVAAAHRIALPFSEPWEYVCTIVEQAPELRNSLLVDLTKGVKTEIEHVNGAVIAAGRRAGVTTPYNDAVYRLVSARTAATSG
jgi:2-dehydropantoate 2-reductase